MASDAEPVVESVRDAIRETVGSGLVGLYLVGSLAVGGFEPGVSDIDFIAVLTVDPDDELIAALRRMHRDVIRTRPAWDDRIEVIYVAADRLAGFRSEIPCLLVIGPGEPLHVTRAGPDWVLTWYPAREEAIPLVGPPLDAVIPEIPRIEFLDAVRRSLLDFRHRIQDGDSRGAQAYAILTVCRGLYTLRFGTRPSKALAADWAMREFPEQAGIIHRALGWRAAQWTSSNADGASSIADTRRFVREMTDDVIG